MTENYDQAELNKFASLAAQWWDEESDLKTLHQVNPLRMSYIRKKATLLSKRALDLGCGGGILTEALAQSRAVVTGIDMNKELIEVAKLHQLENNLQITYLQTSAEKFAAEHPNSFDVICCLEMLEHVPDPRAIVDSIGKLAKSGANIFFSTLNRNPKSYLYAILGAEYFLKILPKNTHDYAKFIRPSELCNWANQAGLEPQEMIGIHYNPFAKTFRFSNDISVNYLLHAKKT